MSVNLTTTPKTLLIIGDMIVDDSWLVGQYKSPTATHIGRDFFRSLQHPGSAVKQHCGVGRVAALLRHARLSNPNGTVGPSFTKALHILGLWSSIDSDNYLKRMFVPANLMGSNSHRVVPPPGSPPVSGVHLHNLGDILSKAFGYKPFTAPDSPADSPIFPYVPESAVDAAFSKYFGTNRVYRLYKRSGQNVEQLWRIDWEISPQSTDDSFPSWLPADIPQGTSEIFAELLLDPETTLPLKCDAVIIKDNAKGVVSLALIKLLLNDP